MIVDFTNETAKNKLPAFFIDFGGQALFDEQKTGIKLNLYNLSRYYTNVVIPAAQKGLVFVALEDNEIVGFSFAESGLNDEFQLEEPIISGVFTYVRPDYRKRGIATELRKSMMQQMIKLGYKRIVCQIRNENNISQISMKRFIETIPHETFTGYIARI